MKRSFGENALSCSQLKRARYEETDEALFRRVTTEGEVFLPQNVAKYQGCYKRLKPDIVRPWKVTFHNKYVNGHKYPSTRHATEEAAIQHIKEVNCREGWPIKNLIFLYEGAFYVVLTQQKVMKFSEAHRELVERYTWHAHRATNCYSFVARACKGDGKSDSFQNLMFAGVDCSVRHMNGNTLDNTVENVACVALINQ